jgi:antitoxin CptB
VFQRFWEQQGDDLSEHDEEMLRRLLAMEDHDLWALVSGREKADDVELAAMADRLRLLKA